MRDGLGDWIGRRQRLGVVRQGKAADKELKVCGIPMETLRYQWEHQKETQLSLRARKYPHLPISTSLICFHLDAPVRLKKELDVVLGLQSDIDTVKTALTRLFKQLRASKETTHASSKMLRYSMPH